jgi:hypothetical protein
MQSLTGIKDFVMIIIRGFDPKSLIVPRSRLMKEKVVNAV